MWTIIDSVYAITPKNIIINEDIENKISESFEDIPRWVLHEMTWVKTRYFVDENEYPSDLAIRAWEKCLLESSILKDDIDLMIFASASQDITEPATANIIQKEMKLNCPVFDVKNACNSFMNAIDIADWFIQSDKYKNILIVSGETPSKAIKFWVENRSDFKKHFAWYTFWDAWTAMVLRKWEWRTWIQHSYFYSDGETWDLATIMWGGVRYLRDVDKTYFVWDPGKIRDKFMSIGIDEFEKGMDILWWKRNDIQKVFVHQVAMSNFQYMTDLLSLDLSKFQIILSEYWNIASCCIPMAFFQYVQNGGSFKKWDKFVFIGFASGFSYGLIFYEA